MRRPPQRYGVYSVSATVVADLTDKEIRILDDDEWGFERLLGPEVVPIEQEKNSRNLSDGTNRCETKRERVCDWLLKKGLTYEMEKSLTYSDITRHTQEGPIHQKTVWRNDYDSSLEMECDTPFLTTK